MNLLLQEKELLRRIDEVLHYMWDPIGVAGVPQARDEYQSYAPQVFQLLKRTVDGKDVADYLSGLALERFGMRSNPMQVAEIVEVLLEWQRHLGE
jgi:CubicO group peptidase (beta-lactamase class C family)